MFPCPHHPPVHRPVFVKQGPDGPIRAAVYPPCNCNPFAQIRVPNVQIEWPSTPVVDSNARVQTTSAGQGSGQYIRTRLRLEGRSVRRLEKFRDPREMVNAVYVAMKALQRLFEDANIVHGDICPANINIDEELGGRLIDWDDR
ncbi:hypothetical protein K488DRAFT_85344 [Vararia minispora EC-137]|uniref:Uncharacterized protein n=1 Tax=Vararia minispora EC-137 TaxID=1314806 RepID=A0ACB8QM94_9AGAM|nr:hypothetical protein K488DRAFT_85344 [Vararia minispora EC-137]